MLCVINYKNIKKPLPWKGLLVEIGFGRGDHLIKLGKENPDKKILGFELSNVSVEKLLKRVRREGLTNVHCVRLDAYWGFYFLLEEGSVERIYINYPDPWFKKKHHKRRLTGRKNLYIFSKKLRSGGEILIRTDYLPFAEFTLQEAEWLGGFDVELRELSVDEPVTKYERKWLSMGRSLYELRLKKSGEPKSLDIPTVKEVQELFPVKLSKEPNLKKLEGMDIRLSETVILKTFRSFEGAKSSLLEVLLSEEGFVQKFFLEAKRTGSGWVVDVSPHSQVLRTENIQRVIEFLAQESLKP
jgi:tRNA (guanine-N7-)-methyltransferase